MDIGNGWNVEIDKLSLPLGADLERDTPWGTDELGFKQFRTATGKIYSLRPQSPIAPQTQGGSLARVKEVIGSMVRGAFDSAKAGITAPGRALMGEPVTVGDVFNTAGMAAVGASAMPAPKGALRALNLQPGQTLEEAMRSAFPDLKIDIRPSRGNGYVLSRIVVPKDARNSGIGSRAMTELVETADQQGATLALSPSSDFGGSVSRLKEFYRRFGFGPNKGRNADYAISESMYRAPQNVPSTPLK